MSMGLISGTGRDTVRSRGSFVAGATGTFLLNFTDITGVPYDPTSITIQFYDPNGDLVTVGDETSIIPEKMTTGEYVVDFSINTDDVTGVYTMTYTFVASTTGGEVIKTVDETFIVVPAGTVSVTGTTQLSQMRAYLEALLGSVQNIPVKTEQAEMNKDRTIAKFTFGKWNQPAGIRLYRNNNLLDESTDGFTTDWLNGKIYFDQAQESSDVIQCDYNFRWFDDQVLDTFIFSGINRVNLYPPFTTYGVGTLPFTWQYVGSWGAAVDAIRTILMDLITQQPRLVFADPDSMISNLQDLKRNYEDELKNLLEQKKFGSFQGLMKAIVAPEMAIPGGRCLSRYTSVIYKENDIVLEDIIENVYTLFKNGHQIKVLSENNNELTFEVVSKIWKSGIKPLLKITTENGYSVDVSEDHIMFVDNKETLAKHVQKGDYFTVIENNRIIMNKVATIASAKPVMTYDIEVPSTENLFTNKIKTHNSRWLRAIFK